VVIVLPCPRHVNLIAVLCGISSQHGAQQISTSSSLILVQPVVACEERGNLLSLGWARLFDCHASFVEPPRKGHPMPRVWIMLPDGSHITSDQPNANAVLSRFFEREVTLAKTAPDSPALEEYCRNSDRRIHCALLAEGQLL